jgi:hypothetical protein
MPRTPSTNTPPLQPGAPSPTPNAPSLPPILATQPNPGLVGSFDKTNLDIENPRPNGGIPYKKDKDPTVYPTSTQHQTPTHGYFATPGQAADKFEQKYSPNKTYLDSMKNYI